MLTFFWSWLERMAPKNPKRTLMEIAMKACHILSKLQCVIKRKMENRLGRIAGSTVLGKSVTCSIHYSIPMMAPAYYKKRCAAFPFETGIHYRRKTDFFPEEDTTISYSGFEPEPTWLPSEGHSHPTGWATY
ncbi:hypothetical protein TNCV_2436201 [Trichonephila clavipes]|nr:hypothetical protein TNCV_2436201 [Trichonephila clavipes]